LSSAHPFGRIGGFRRAGQGIVTILFALVITGSIAAASAPTRPGPQTSLTPELKSEIRRGYLAVNSCKTAAHDPDSFDDCLQPVIGKETNSPHVYYFMLGLELGCWRLFDTTKEKYAEIYYFELRSYQEHLGVTDEQLLTATRTHDTHARARLAYWAANRPTTPVALRPVSPSGRQWPARSNLAFDGCHFC
jgi:hypothetical protein